MVCIGIDWSSEGLITLRSVVRFQL